MSLLILTPLHPILTRFCHRHSLFIRLTFSFTVAVYLNVLLQLCYSLYTFWRLKPKLILRADTPQDDTQRLTFLRLILHRLILHRLILYKMILCMSILRRQILLRLVLCRLILHRIILYKMILHMLILRRMILLRLVLRRKILCNWYSTVRYSTADTP